VSAGSFHSPPRPVRWRRGLWWWPALVLAAAWPLRADETTTTTTGTETTTTDADDTSPYHVALLNYKSGKFDDALTAIDEAEKSGPTVPVELLKVRILTEQENFDPAAKILADLQGRTDPSPAYAEALTLTTGDFNLRRRHFDDAAKSYLALLDAKPDDSDVILKLIYTRVSVGDFVRAGKYLSQLKPLDPIHPGYYFAQAAIEQANGDRAKAEQDIETVRTIYGITVTNRYLKTYLQVFSPAKNEGSASEVPVGTNTAPAAPMPAPAAP